MHDADSPVRVLIVDDHVAMRIGLASILSCQNALHVSGVASNAEEALALLKREPVNVILLDLRMPEVDGIRFIHEVMQRRYPVRILVLTSYESEEEIYRAVNAGAHGYLLKDADEEELIKAVLSVYHGDNYFPPNIAAKLTERMHRRDLSGRELEVLEMLAKGLTNKQIASALAISSHTVRCHVANISAKLHVADRTEAVALALGTGMIQRD